MEWQPIETAPRDGTRIIVFVPEFNNVTFAWYSDTTGLWPEREPFCDDGEPCNVGLPSHWMPLPKAPE